MQRHAHVGDHVRPGGSPRADILDGGAQGHGNWVIVLSTAANTSSLMTYRFSSQTCKCHARLSTSLRCISSHATRQACCRAAAPTRKEAARAAFCKDESGGKCAALVNSLAEATCWRRKRTSRGRYSRPDTSRTIGPSKNSDGHESSLAGRRRSGRGGRARRRGSRREARHGRQVRHGRQARHGRWHAVRHADRARAAPPLQACQSR